MVVYQDAARREGVFFRAKTYKQLCRKMRKAGERVKNSMGEAAHKQLLQELSTLSALGIHKAAMQEGFMEEWLQAGGNKRKARCGACATRQPVLWCSRKTGSRSAFLSSLSRTDRL